MTRTPTRRPRQAAHPPPGGTRDRTLRLLAEGYQFMPSLFAEYGVDVVETRLLGRRAMCVRGPEAAEMFYRSSDIERSGAVPLRVQKTLFGREGVQTLDGLDHRRRKAVFMSLVTPDGLERFDRALATELAELADQVSGSSVSVMDLAGVALTKAGCRWAGVPLDDPYGRAADMAAMVAGFAAVGPRHWRARSARRRSERWAVSLIDDVRDGRETAPPDSVLEIMALRSGKRLPTRIAAVELLNVIRPIVAIRRFVAFSVLALHEHGVVPDSDQEREWFVQEVRRFYPFAPFVGGRVARSFRWRDVTFPEGHSVFLDVYGANHDPALWSEPQRFRPRRFEDRSITPYDFVPQGGGGAHDGHRCPGEELTVRATKAFVRFFTSMVHYAVPPQDLSIDLGRIPTHPADGMVIASVERQPEQD